MLKPRNLIVILVIVLICTGNSSMADVELPTYASLKVIKVLYDFSPSPENNLLGDGYYGKVALVEEKEMKNFVNNITHTKLANLQWSKGDLITYKLHLEILEHIERCVESTIGKKELKKLNKAIDLGKLKQNKTIYHSIKYRKSNGLIRDAEIWILIPDKNIVCILRHHT